MSDLPGWRSRPQEIQPGEPGHDHCGGDDRLEKPAFHHLEGFWLALSLISTRLFAN